MSTLHEFSATSLAGQPVDLARYKGSVVLVVNTASKCGFTPQFAGLETLWERYQSQGLTVIGFPCNQFGSQELDDADQIGEFCTQNYGVSFPMMGKVDVNGENAHPLFTWLKGEAGGILSSAIKWNFTKFLIDRNGTVIKRYPPTTPPEKLEADIKAALTT